MRVLAWGTGYSLVLRHSNQIVKVICCESVTRSSLAVIDSFELQYRFADAGTRIGTVESRLQSGADSPGDERGRSDAGDQSRHAGRQETFTQRFPRQSSVAQLLGDVVRALP